MAVAGLALMALTACENGQSEKLQTQVDSLTAKVEQQANDLSYYSSCLTLLSEGLDSIATYDNTLYSTIKSKEGTITKESIRENLHSYASMLERQKNRISELENKLNNTNSEVTQMKSLIAYFKKQIEEKDATIARLQETVERKDFEISMLEATIDKLTTMNANLNATIKSQGEVITTAQNMLNEAYYIIGTSKELKRLNIIKGSKLNTKEDFSLEPFTRIDIREITQIAVNDKNIEIKSQHPKNSYHIVNDKKNNTSIIYIDDEVKFWSISRYLVIEK